VFVDPVSLIVLVVVAALVVFLVIRGRRLQHAAHQQWLKSEASSSVADTSFAAWKSASAVALQQHRSEAMAAQIATPASGASPTAQNGTTNVLAIVSFVLVFFGAVPAIVLGHVALNQIHRTGQQGRGLAIAALIIGYVLTIGGLVGVGIYLYAQAHVGFD
jgi:preprotein translocase subunit SecG